MVFRIHIHPNEFEKMESENDEVKNRLKRRYTELGKKIHDLEVTFVQTFGIEIAAEFWSDMLSRPKSSKMLNMTPNCHNKNERKLLDILIYV